MHWSKHSMQYLVSQVLKTLHYHFLNFPLFFSFFILISYYYWLKSRSHLLDLPRINDHLLILLLILELALTFLYFDLCTFFLLFLSHLSILFVIIINCHLFFLGFLLSIICSLICNYSLYQLPNFDFIILHFVYFNSYLLLLVLPFT